MKISARNKLQGTVKSVEKGVVTAKIQIEIKTPTAVTAVITKEAVEELNLKVGDTVKAIVKATGVIVAKDL